MVYTILISIVFIAEIIIAITIIKKLFEIDKKVIDLDNTISQAKPNITDISVLCRKISEQFIELTHKFVKDLKIGSEDFSLKILSKLLIALILLKINSKTINRFRKSGIGKILGRGLSLLENMV